MQSVSSRIWTRIAVFISYGNNNYTTGTSTTLNGGSLKLVDKFTYLGSCISSTENDINVWLAKVWTTINRLSIICKSDLFDKIKCIFFQADGDSPVCVVAGSIIWRDILADGPAYLHACVYAYANVNLQREYKQQSAVNLQPFPDFILYELSTIQSDRPRLYSADPNWLYTVLKIWETWSISSLLLFPVPLWPGVVIPVRVLSMVQIDLLKIYLYSIEPCKKMILHQKC